MSSRGRVPSGLRRWGLVGALVAISLAGVHGHADAGGDNTCRVINLELTPTDDAQMVVWLEDGAGNYVDTLFITRLTGSFGIGNRPGMMPFNSAWRWPYGRRVSTFPVWAHRHGHDFPTVEFQNGDDTNLSHPLSQSSLETFYCKPLRDGDIMWDTQTCASTVYTDKGVANETVRSLYPPRTDVSVVDGIDHTSVGTFGMINPFDVVSRATPPGGELFQINWAIPDNLPDAAYTVYVEINTEWDQNTFYDYPAPVGIPWSDYGLAARGQPSVVYKVDFTLKNGATDANTLEYVGYGDPDGLDGNIRPPDMTITSGVAGSGASRLMLTSKDGEMFRVRAKAQPTDDNDAPAGVGSFKSQEVNSDQAIATFTAPGDDSMTGRVAGYEVKIMAGTPMTEANFATARPPTFTPIAPIDPGQTQTVTVSDLLPKTNYYLGIRAYDECLNYGPLQVLHLTTPERESGNVDACFIATAAYGSMIQGQVQLLRNFRDAALRSNVPGELFVESYYTFAPAVSKLIAPSDLLRRVVRAGLGPLLDAVKKRR